MSSPTFNPVTLVTAIQTLFTQNSYKVDGPLKVHGAEIDLRAISNSDPFAPTIYIEATVEYVDTEKYGKDSSKFLLLRTREPNATLLCISSSGFSLPVKERAQESRVETLTYDELFTRFQRFNEYIERVLGEGELGSELTTLSTVYEEAFFEDTLGRQNATEFLSAWQVDPAPENPWIIVAGDYGTGKTALTKILLRRWMSAYQANPSLPIPFRIELRDFTRQFDARGLLHHFLDTNGIGYIPVDFVFSLIKQGRIVLLLDGYDEMAQYMQARERRACLAALAELSKDGAKGILTSRPNYFTEAEELRLLEALYSSLSADGRLSTTGRGIIESEQALDRLLETQYLERYERFLRDLNKDQTRNLIRRVLADDPQGQETILTILDKTFTTTDDGAAVSLSGKPVIISYLLDVVEELKAGSPNDANGSSSSALTEWQIYDLIVDRLMWRDYKRAPEITPSERRMFLQRLSLQLSSSQGSTLEERGFFDLVQKVFASRLKHISSDVREQEARKLFADLRSSATLTKPTTSENSGWRFSHNSLREYLAAEYLVNGLKEKDTKIQRIQISDAMRTFVRSLPTNDRETLIAAASNLHSSGCTGEVMGLYTTLIWDAGLRLLQPVTDAAATLTARIFGNPPSPGDIFLDRIQFSQNGSGANLTGIDFSGASLSDVDFGGSKLIGAKFDGAILQGISFKDADLTDTSFRGAILIEVDFSLAKLNNAVFVGLADHSAIRTPKGVYDGELALGYLAFEGARTDSVSTFARAFHHPNYPIAEKIARKLREQAARQKRGLTQRGPAAKDPATARRFLQLLMSNDLVEEYKGREEMVGSTEKGRPILSAFCEGTRLDDTLAPFFDIQPKK